MAFKRKLSESVKKIIASKQGWNCNICFNILPASYQIDHIIPHSISQNDSYDNLVALCPTCHANKTQSELSRIRDFKFLKRHTKSENDMCWFCLQTYIPGTNHYCNKIKSDIQEFITNKTNIMNITTKNFDNFSYVPSIMRQNIINLEKLSLSESSKQLNIRLTPSLIFVNTFFTDSNDYSLEVIKRAIFISTRSKKESNKYNNIQFNIDIDDINDNCIEFLDENILYLIPKRIIDENCELEVTYILNN